MQAITENYLIRILLRFGLTATTLSLIITVTQELRAESHKSLLFTNKETYLIYNEALKFYADQQKALKVSIVRFTALDRGMTRCLQTIEDKYESAMWRSAIKDMREKNSAIYLIEPEFDVPFNFRLADSMETIGGARNPPPGKSELEFLEEEMEKLKKQSQENYIQVQISAPGISDDKTIALVNICISFAGEVLVLNRKDNKWIVDPKPLCNWIS